MDITNEQEWPWPMLVSMKLRPCTNPCAGVVYPLNVGMLIDSDRTISEHWWIYLTAEPCDCRDSLTQAVEEVNIVIKFNSLLTTLSKHPQADRFARGLGPISLGKTVKIFAIILLVSSTLFNIFFGCVSCIAGEHDHDRRADDLKILYKAYATEVLSDGIVDDEKVI